MGGLFSPGLLDDVDSVYIQIAREMLQRHDFVTPTIDGIRFFDKPPLMYWMAAASMRIFGVHDWAARLPLALGVLALLLAVYALGNRLYGNLTNPPNPCPDSRTWVSRTFRDNHNIPSDRAGLYAALAMATAIGPYLYTRFYIPDILIALWMTLSVHLFLIALDRVTASIHTQDETCHGAHHETVILSEGARSLRAEVEGPAAPLTPGTPAGAFQPRHASALLPMLGFGATLALDVLTKGLIGVVFPILFVLLYLACTHRLKLLAKLHIPAATALFLALAAPWHILAALRNPAIAMPAGIGLPARAGWAWFYLYNEHIARFLGKRIPHDYGQVPIPLFWLLLVLWLVPWAAFLPAALMNAFRALRTPKDAALRFDSDIAAGLDTLQSFHSSDRTYEAALAPLLWAGIILGFFTLSSRQEYYHLPALPALALLVGGLLAAADHCLHDAQNVTRGSQRQALRGSLFFLVPLGSLLFLVCGYLALVSPTPQHGVTLSDLLSTNPELYNLSLGHVFDLTKGAMGFFRGPLLAVALCMLALGPGSHLLRRRGRTLAANLVIAASMTGVLLAAHEGLKRFYPILGSKDLALAIDAQRQAGDLIAIDGELTAGSTLLFYTGKPVLLINGHVNGPWFGSFWPDAPHIFANDDDLHHLWGGPHRIFLLTYDPKRRTQDLVRFGQVVDFADSGGKTILTNR